MQRIFIQRFIIVLSFIAFSAFADLSSSITNLIAIDKGKNEKIGVYVQNLETGAVLYEYNANEPFTPASTTKVFTAAAAYLSLGPEYRYSTIVSTNAPIARTLKGDVFIHFSGDPTLSNIDINIMFHQIRLRGVRNISGNLIIDQSIFTGPYYGEGWTYNDIESCEGAPITGAIVNSNCSSEGVVKHPNIYIQTIVRTALRSEGIHLTGKIIEGQAPTGTVILATHDSNSLKSILSHMLKYSDDVYANAIFKTIGKSYGDSGSYGGGALATDQILTTHLGSSFQLPQLKDGSGLSTLNLISPQQLVALYNYMYHQPELAKSFRQSLAISGQDGTLVYRLNDRLLAGNVYAKTGTFHHDDGGVSSLAGYLILPGRDHPVIGFAIMTNNIAGDTSRAEFLQDQIVKAIAENELS
ncbi:MAG: D-alanyl-D-alanine carboxypeptidase/D-alanyl-D-alanine-endopeptidase [Gammaproteobacteria bacterium]|nr:D-alanyl-D-alanine carboxypeptidase/D-alanyl-D-alanine-endopeptidase [Gammaproteobacteria bacterium]